MSNNPNPNPNHQELLSLIPGELHPLLIPVLKKWDQNVNDQFAKIRGEYDEFKPYKALIDAGIDPTFAQQAAGLVNRLQQDPETILREINDNWNLGYLPKDQVPPATDEDPEMTYGDDFFNDPRVKAMADTLSSLQNQFKQQEEKEANEAALAELEDELDGLEEATTGKNLPFDRTFVMALMSQGFSGDEAVTHLHTMLAAQGVNTLQQQEQQQDQSPPPVVLGGAPSGSGLPEQPIKFGSLSRKDLNNTVAQMLAQAQQSNQG